MGSIISKIYDAIKLHGSMEKALAFDDEQARKWMHTERPKSLIPMSRRVPPPPPPIFKDGGVMEKVPSEGPPASVVIRPDVHYLKTLPNPFQAVSYCEKKAEMRLNDRDFKVGDILVLLRYDPILEIFTGEKLERRITHVLEGGQFGIEQGYVMLSITDFPPFNRNHK